MISLACIALSHEPRPATFNVVGMAWCTQCTRAYVDVMSQRVAGGLDALMHATILVWPMRDRYEAEMARCIDHHHLQPTLVRDVLRVLEEAEAKEHG